MVEERRCDWPLLALLYTSSSLTSSLAHHTSSMVYCRSTPSCPFVHEEELCFPSPLPPATTLSRWARSVGELGPHSLASLGAITGLHPRTKRTAPPVDVHRDPRRSPRNASLPVVEFRVKRRSKTGGLAAMSGAMSREGSIRGRRRINILLQEPDAGER
ncbi:hypothetical protein BDZ90DRAFT_65684 [Jaminaea rosea]|uniref:Uncharacterized protein n=1 Tax=Jaminaea rosea TaxID=1569628 RepID=A0A316UM58_9BASI|nr:hypothetical protein BDZ90DRAFT_65684 [Jaminaea rosea]PWN25898.1 hypothetical protein BDZ90DRAFT_65684 [Jaminaea rosea]